MLNEHDIKDFPNSPYSEEPKLLWNLQKDDKFVIDDTFASNIVYTFKKVDGMYSVCYDQDGILMHFHVGTPVKVVKG